MDQQNRLYRILHIASSDSSDSENNNKQSSEEQHQIKQQYSAPRVMKQQQLSRLVNENNNELIVFGRQGEEIEARTIVGTQNVEENSYSGRGSKINRKRPFSDKSSSRNKKRGNNDLSMEMIADIKRFKDYTIQNFIDKKAQTKQKQYTINKKQIYFPFEAYDVQVIYMQKVLQCLQGATNGLLESPTGTGKTLCLLSSVLSWIYHQKLMGRHRKVLYLSRTHSQLAQVIKQLKTTCFRPTMSIVGSRDHLCIKPELDILKGRQKMQACSKGVHLNLKDRKGEIDRSKMTPQQLKLFKQTICNFYQEKSQTVQIVTRHFSNTIMDMQQIKDKGRIQPFCPYYYPFHMDQYCDFFVMPYNYILDADLLPRFASMITNSVIIFDQAHNVAEASCQGRSYEMFLSSIKGAETQLIKILFNTGISEELRKIRTSKSAVINQIQKFVKDLQGTINDYLSKIPFNQAPIQTDKLYYNNEQKQRIKVIDSKITDLALYELIAGELSHSQRQIFQQRNSASHDMVRKLNRKINEFGGNVDQLIECLKETPDGIFHNLQKVTTFCRKISSLLYGNIFGRNFMDNQINHYRLVFRVMFNEIRQIESYIIELRCLVPWLTFKNILEYSPRSIIFTSGTMAPLNFWQSQLNIKAPVRLENKHVINHNQVKLNIIKNNRLNHPFNFKFQNIKQNSEFIYIQLIQTLLQIYKTVPNGILVICPNFKTLNQIRFHLRNKKLYQKLSNVKHQVFEQRSNNDYIDKFKALSHDGAVLYCVCRGKASEGIDFPDHTCRAVIFVGVPYPNVRDPILIERREHFKKLNQQCNDERSQITWDQWYFNSTIRAINQGLGRVIRHVKDYGMLILLDQRYTQRKFSNGLPKWAITRGIQTWESPNAQHLAMVQQFYTTNDRKYPNQKLIKEQKKQEKQSERTKPKKVYISSVRPKTWTILDFMNRK